MSEYFSQYKKDCPKIMLNDVYDFIHKHSNLTKKQIIECFSTYAKMIEIISQSESRNENLIICMPKLGNIKFYNYRGRKKGTKYKVPSYYGSKVMEEKIVEEDEPDFDRMKFEFIDKFQKNSRESSIKRHNKKIDRENGYADFNNKIGKGNYNDQT